MQIVPGDFAYARVLDLLRAHLYGEHADSPPGNVFALDLSGLKAPEVSFYAAWDDQTLTGMGALKALGDGRRKIKSIRTHDALLRNSVGAHFLEHIIGEAWPRRYRRLGPETGSGPAFDAAWSLCRRFGFDEAGVLGIYEKS